MPGLSADELASEARRYEMYRAGMAGVTDEYSAKLQAAWRAYDREATRRAVMLRRQLSDSLHKTIGSGRMLNPEEINVWGFRASADERIWTWLDREFDVMHLRRMRRGGDGVEINNRLWNPDAGAGRKLVEDAKASAREAAASGADALRKAQIPQARKVADSFESGAELDEALADGQSASWMDNIVRSLEQFAHQASAAIIDATSGLNARAAVLDIADQIDPVSNQLYLSYTTHPRAVYRASLASAGEAIGADKYLYYLPADARAAAAPTGWGANQHLKMRSRREWESARQALDQKRPGSFAWTTGFHAGDAGVLLPIPVAWESIASESERRKRQAWLEKLRAREGAA